METPANRETNLPETRGEGPRSNAIGFFLDALVLVFSCEPPGRLGEEFKAYRKALEERGGHVHCPTAPMEFVSEMALAKRKLKR